MSKVILELETSTLSSEQQHALLILLGMGAITSTEKKPDVPPLKTAPQPQAAPAPMPTAPQPQAAPAPMPMPTAPAQRVEFASDYNTFKFDGVEVTPNIVRMATGLVVVQKGRKADVDAKLSSMGYADVTQLIATWEAHKNATHVATFYEFLKSIV